MVQQREELKKSISNNKRRTFLKKVAYAAPVLTVMGQLTRPTEARAGFGGTPSQPEGK
ncbi:hypothetical protein MNB_SV-4-1262 [hydrothermal vent metagenome]|uniref:Uncharacterized protein n=1 Tax=hydrothermal vent metagenome TaxID=652676 RepID=A0A1W1E8Q9_9ZZZZ